MVPEQTPAHHQGDWWGRHPVVSALLGLAFLVGAIWFVFWPLGHWLVVTLFSPVWAALTDWWRAPLLDWTTGQTLLVLLIVVAAIRAR